MKSQNKEYNNKKISNNQYSKEEYSKFLQQLKIDTTKLKNNLQKINTSQYDELIILIESGSLAPPHKMHIQILEITKSQIEKDSKKKVIAAFLVPSSDDYVSYKLKNDFISLKNRVNMSKLLCKNNDWIDVLDWGIANGQKIRMLFDEKIKNEFPIIKIKSLLVFGIDYYLRKGKNFGNGYVCVYRPGYDFEKFKNSGKYENFIFVEDKGEDISSTKIREAIRKNDMEAIKGMTSNDVLEYIKNNNIFEK